MSFWKWSRTAANNATADGSINWAEGQAPSTVNDSARAMMAAASKYRDDVAGAIATAGSASAYTLASFQVFDTLAHMDGAMIAFTAHAGNGGACTLNVDGLGAKPLRSAPSTEIIAHDLRQPVQPHRDHLRRRRRRDHVQPPRPARLSLGRQGRHGRQKPRV